MPVIAGRMLSLALAGSLQLFWAPLLSHEAPDLRRLCTLCVCLSALGKSLAHSLAPCCAAAPMVASAFGEQVQVGSCLQEVGTCSRFLESCATWLPGRGRSASLYPGPEPGSSAPGRVWSPCPLQCPGEGSLAAGQGQRGRPSGVGEGPRVGAGGSGERALGILSSPSTFAGRSSYSGALQSTAWQPCPVRIQ